MSNRLDALASYLRLVRWSGSDLARAIGVTPGYVNGVLSGTRKPSPKFKRDATLVLAPWFGIEPTDLYHLFFTRGDAHARI